MQENASHVITLPLFKLNLPAVSLFEPQIQQLTDVSFALENRKLKIRASKFIQRKETARLFIEGLFQASRCHTPDTGISIPLTQQHYKKGSQSKITRYAYRDVRACFDALERLGWIGFHKGFVDPGDISYPTVLWAFGDLNETFKQHKNLWQKLTSEADPPLPHAITFPPARRHSVIATTPRATCSGSIFSASCFTAILSKKCWDARARKRSRVSLSIALLCAKVEAG